MRELSTAFAGVVRALTTRAAAEQGGLLSGQDPTAVNLNDPLRLWIVQLGVIVMTTQLLALGLRKIRQPKVIAEVIGGILLGPTAFGRIPGFTEHIFPQASRPFLSLVANIGLCLFLFLVGLEIDAQVIKRNARLSVTVALAGMVLPFGLGAGLAVPLYHEFIDQSVKFTNFMLFTGVAYSITAFPVLCRILTELKLLDTTVGIVVLSAGVGNDIIGWTLLALSVALVNAGSGLMALWILLVCVGWTLFLLFVVRRILYWVARKTGSIRDGPSMFFMTVVILLLFGSAFFTDIIGVHAIFGAFLAGIIVPREGGLAIALTEKLEDMVSIIFLPLYFTLSGLSTDLGLLNNGITWAYTIAICALAYFGKFGGCTAAARWAGFTWREAGAIGSLMSCKGLVELIVLNVGLSAGILSQRVFSMFVLEALLLTFLTTPAVTVFYPPHLRVRAGPGGDPDWRAQKETPEDATSASETAKRSQGDDDSKKTRFTVILDKIEHLPGMLSLTQLILPSPPPYSDTDPRSVTSGSTVDAYKDGASPEPVSTPMSLDAIRLIELSDRTSAVMKSSNIDSLTASDPLLDIFTTFGALHGVDVSTSLSIVPFDDLGASAAERATRRESQLILVPWFPPHVSIDIGHANMTHANATASGFGGHGGGAMPTPRLSSIQNPFEAMFRATAAGAEERDGPLIHAQFVRGLFAAAKTDVALFVDRHTPGTSGKGAGMGAAMGRAGRYRLFVPFFGGPDDRLALDFAVQLCANPKISATVVRVTKAEDAADAETRVQSESPTEKNEAVNTATVASVFPDTVYGNATTQTRLQSETADNIAWTKYTRNDEAALAPALARITFLEASTAKPLHHVVDEATRMCDPHASPGVSAPRLLVLAGRSRRMAVENHHAELKALIEEHGGIVNAVKRTVGDVATALVVAGCEANLIVFQAALPSD
ncbi:Sodium/hydrogen exchanger family-domain-containing protein [Epithele typhae]|uniref:Sodium/hydrogen exchanger family-domain-containing protein n=1 Tax=Epithele typhae TaxID=378194 RepID=UPI00200738B5|nr:Sodium/hydrogen exchanger family-domain-containing protein [Epithele typhae]KAH9924338.1 Sodium/hydrogen exchanger family-domain-containing protein [Epithele typhae]